MDGLLLLAGAAGLLAVRGLHESASHRRRLSRIPIRLHVNGTRGKSSVTRLITAGLRAGGIRAVGKVTGTCPRLLLPDGREEPILRRGRANVIEQVEVVRRAVEVRAEALVMECMAVHPLLQSLCERKLVRSTHGVITNARADHLDVMGPSPGDVAAALAGTVPVRGKLFTAEREHLGTLAEAARDRGARLVPVTEDEVRTVSEADLAGFGYVEHPDNVSLALRVCAEFGIDRPAALRGMWAATPDPGAMQILNLEEEGRRLQFVNAFAANDAASTNHVWNLALQRAPQVARRVVVVNCRADRPERSAQLAETCARWRTADRFLITGGGTCVFRRRAEALGLSAERACVVQGRTADELERTLFAESGPSSLAVGVGNVAGVGLELVRRLEARMRRMASTHWQEAA